MTSHAAYMRARFAIVAAAACLLLALLRCGVAAAPNPSCNTLGLLQEVPGLYPFTGANMLLSTGVSLGTNGPDRSSLKLANPLPSTGNSVSAGWLVKPLRIVSGFNLTFTFNLALGGQGFAVVFAAACGCGSGLSANTAANSLGYGFKNSFAIEIDTFKNTDLTDTLTVPHVELHTRYTEMNNASSLFSLNPSTNVNDVSPNVAGSLFDAPHTCTITYDPTLSSAQFKMRIDAGAILSATIDESQMLSVFNPNKQQAYIGFTSSASLANFGSVEIWGLRFSNVPIAITDSKFTDSPRRAYLPQAPATFFLASALNPPQPQAVVQTYDACGWEIRTSSGGSLVTVVFDGFANPSSYNPPAMSIIDLNTGQYAIYVWSPAPLAPFSSMVVHTRVGGQEFLPSYSIAFGPGVANTTQSYWFSAPPPTEFVAGQDYAFSIKLRDSTKVPTILKEGESISYGFVGSLVPAIKPQIPSSFSDFIFTAPTMSSAVAGSTDDWTVQLSLDGTTLPFFTNKIAVVAAQYVPSKTQLGVMLSWVTAGSAVSKFNARFYDAYGNPASISSVRTTEKVKATITMLRGGHPVIPPTIAPLTVLPQTVLWKADGQVDVNYGGVNWAGFWNFTLTIDDVVVRQLEYEVRAAEMLRVDALALESTVGIVGQEVTFLLNPFDAYGNPALTMLDSGISGPLVVTIKQFRGRGQPDLGIDEQEVPCASARPGVASIPVPLFVQCAWDMRTLSYVVYVQCTVATELAVSVTLGAVVQPLTTDILLIVHGQPDPVTSTAKFGSRFVDAGSMQSFRVTVRDASETVRDQTNDVAVIQASVTPFNPLPRLQPPVIVNISVDDVRGLGYYLVNYRAFTIGEYDLAVKLNGTLLSSSLRVEVSAAAASASATNYFNIPLEIARGETVDVMMQLNDAWQNPLTGGGAAITFGFNAGNFLASATDLDNGKFRVTIIVSESVPKTENDISVVPSVNGVAAPPIVLRLSAPPIIVDDPCSPPQLVCGAAATCTIVQSEQPQTLGNVSSVCTQIMQVKSVQPTIANANGGGVIVVTMTGPLEPNFEFSIGNRFIEIQQIIPEGANRRPASFRFTMPSGGDLGLVIPPASSGAGLGLTLSATLEESISLNGTLVSKQTSVSDQLHAVPRKLTRLVPNALRLVNTTCIFEGRFWIVETDECVACSKNAFCPGGARAWPLPGFYSKSETQREPDECLLAEACVGYDAERATEVGYTFDAESQCSDGYKSFLCSKCTDSFYLDNQKCRNCGLDTSSRTKLLLTAIAALVIFAVMSIGVAFISDERLVLFITIIVFIQQCSFVGSIGASRLDTDGASEFFGILALLNFEIVSIETANSRQLVIARVLTCVWLLCLQTYFKLGCSVPQIGYLDVLGATCLMICIAAVMLIVASGLYAFTRTVEFLQRKSVSRMKAWRQRVQNSMVVLAVVVYLQMTTQFIKGLFCVTIDDQRVLQVEPTTQCYVGGHLVAAPFIWIGLFVYSIGFPFLCLWLVLRTRELNLWASSAAKFHYLWRGLKIRYIYYKIFSFVTSFALALQITLSTTMPVTVRLGTACLFFGLHVFLVGLLTPYYKRWGNYLAIAGGIGNALSGLAILTILSGQIGRSSSSLGSLSGFPLFAVGLSVLVFLLLLVPPARYLLARLFPDLGAAEDDVLLQAGHYDELARSRADQGRGKRRVKKGDRESMSTMDAVASSDHSVYAGKASVSVSVFKAPPPLPSHELTMNPALSSDAAPLADANAMQSDDQQLMRSGALDSDGIELQTIHTESHQF